MKSVTLGLPPRVFGLGVQLKQVHWHQFFHQKAYFWHPISEEGESTDKLILCSIDIWKLVRCQANRGRMNFFSVHGREISLELGCNNPNQDYQRTWCFCSSGSVLVQLLRCGYSAPTLMLSSLEREEHIVQVVAEGANSWFTIRWTIRWGGTLHIG